MSADANYGIKLLEFDDPPNGILAYAADGGKITGEAANLIWSRIDTAKADGDKLRLYCELHVTPNLSGGLIMDKFKRLGAIFSTVERMAIVGDQPWLDLYATVVDPITSFEVRSFH